MTFVALLLCFGPPIVHGLWVMFTRMERDILETARIQHEAYVAEMQYLAHLRHQVDMERLAYQNQLIREAT